MKTKNSELGMKASIFPIVAALFLALPAAATDFVVTTGNDEVADDGRLSLREAIAAANSNTASMDAPAGEADGDTISFSDVSIVRLNGALPGLVISEDLVIDGGLLTRVDGQGAVRIFEVTAGATDTVVLRRLTLQDGLAADNGGALLVAAGADVTVDQCTLQNNRAGGDARGEGGGAIFNAGTLRIINGSLVGNNEVTGFQGNGGAIFNSGSLQMIDGLLSGNSANRAGGAIEQEGDGSSLILRGVTVRDNVAVDNPGNGGAIHVFNGSATISGGEFSENTAGREGGAIWNGADADMTLEGVNGNLVIQDNIAAGAENNRGGGGVFNLGMLTARNLNFQRNRATGAEGNGGGLMNSGASANLTGTNLTFSSNSANRAGGAIENQGGAVMELTRPLVSANSATTLPGNGGGLHSVSGSVRVIGGSFIDNVAAAEGGGLWASGELIIERDGDTGTQITNNRANGTTAVRGGGGVFSAGGNVTITGASILDNLATAGSGSGGGIFNRAGELLLTDVILSGNVANRAGGGLETSNAQAVTLNNVTMNMNLAGISPGTANPGNGGAIHVSGTGQIAINDSAFSDNMAAREGGALWNSGAGATMNVARTLLENNAALGNSSHDGGGAIFNNGGQLNLSASTVRGNMASGSSGSGGGVLNLTGDVAVTETLFTGNSALRAGGAFEDNASGDSSATPAIAARQTTVTIVRSTMDDNSTGSNPGNGGGVHLTGNGVVTFDRSTASNNNAAREGGGLWNFSTGTLNVVNSTVSGNQAPLGGGLFTQSGSGSLNVTHSTVANNTADTGGGIAAASGANLNVSNSIVGDNTAGVGPDISGSAAVESSVVENTTDASISGDNNSLNQDAQLRTLANYGGPTETHAVVSGPAIDAAATNDCNLSPVNGIDQRNVARFADGDDNGSSLCDSGAFEFNGDITLEVVNRSNGVDVLVEEDSRATGVAALPFSLRNSSASDARLTRVAGRINGDIDFSRQITGVTVFLDVNRNGEVDDAELDLAMSSASSFSATAGNFDITLDGNGRTVAANSETNLIIAVDLNNNNASAIWLVPAALLFSLLLGLGRSGRSAVGKRGRFSLLLLGSVAILQACGGSSSSSDVFNDEDRFRLTLSTIEGTNVDTGNGILGQTLPIEGRQISEAD